MKTNNLSPEMFKENNQEEENSNKDLRKNSPNSYSYINSNVNSQGNLSNSPSYDEIPKNIMENCSMKQFNQVFPNDNNAKSLGFNELELDGDLKEIYLSTVYGTNINFLGKICKNIGIKRTISSSRIWRSFKYYSKTIMESK